ncbi:MAG: zf-HC2 domain-containing protein [Chloroflexi bacterium]|nr:zf-HC2 domain-containing protein [Chloroflexota bacterium]
MEISEELSCKELVELVTDYLEGALSAAGRARFEAHLADCRGCRHHLQQIRHTIRIVGTLTEETIPARAKEKLLHAFRNWKTGTA